MMKSWRLSGGFGLENLKTIEVPEPVAGPGQAVVRVRACSLNFRDLVVMKGGYGRSVTLPVTPLSDGAGEVTAVGAGVTTVKAGDRVEACFMPKWISGVPTDDGAASALGGGAAGMLTEQIAIDATALVQIPEYLSFQEASTLPCAAVTAWNILFRSGRLQAGESVLVQGSGGVSVFALQLAKMAGARVIATSGSDAKLERLKALGADAVVNYKTNPFWDKAAREFTGGRGVDHVVEVGGAGTLPTSLKAVRRGGHIGLVGVLSGAEVFDPRMIFMKSVRLQGIYVGSREMFEEMNLAISAASMRPVIDRVFDFDDAMSAIHYLESGAHVGKIVIEIPA